MIFNSFKSPLMTFNPFDNFIINIFYFQNHQMKAFSLQASVRIKPYDLNNIPELEEQMKEIYKEEAKTAEVFLVCPQAWSQNIIKMGKSQNQISNVFNFCRHVIQPFHSQVDAYSRLMHKLINSFLQGYSCTLFAYGQTGSGKTHTVLGPPGCLTQSSIVNSLVPEEWGIFPRTMVQILHSLEQEKQPFNISASAVEIYFEKVYDLLNKKKEIQVAGIAMKGNKNFLDFSQQSSKVRNEMQFNVGETIKLKLQQRLEMTQQQLRNDGFELKGKQEVSLKNIDDAIKFARLIMITRVSQKTQMNDTSSRSHCLITITLTRNNPNGKAQNNQFIFADLGGSERLKKSQSTGQRKNEACNINSSLSVLGRCILALAKGESYVPFRDSTLTMLLKDSLGGSTKTAMIVTISQDPIHADETLSSLRFGEWCSQVSNVSVKKEIDIEKQKTQIEEDLRRAQEEYQVYQEKGMAGGVNRNFDKHYQDACEKYLSEFNQLQNQLFSLKSKLAELSTQQKQKKDRNTAIENVKQRIAQTEHNIWIIDGQLLRMQCSGLQMKPHQLAKQKELEILHLKAQLETLRLK